MLNLFLALLLSSFGAENLQTSQTETETNKLQEAVDRIARFFRFIRSQFLVCFYVRLRTKTSEDRFAPQFTKVDFGGKIWFEAGNCAAVSKTLGSDAGIPAVNGVVIGSTTSLYAAAADVHDQSGQL